MAGARPTRGRRFLRRALGGALALCLTASVIGTAGADEPAERDFRLWYERAISNSGSASDALAGDAPLRMYKWFSPLKVAAHLDDERTEHGPALRAYVRDYLKRITEATCITAGLTTEESAVAPNVLIILGDSVPESAARYRDAITALWEDDGQEADRFVADPGSAEMNCLFTFRPREKGGDEIATALIFAPVAEDIFATQKCLGTMLFRIMGMLGRPDSESVLNRADAVILPTKDDARALRIHYINQIQNGDSPSHVMTVIGKAQQQGVLP